MPNAPEGFIFLGSVIFNNLPIFVYYSYARKEPFKPYQNGVWRKGIINGRHTTQYVPTSKYSEFMDVDDTLKNRPELYV